MSRQLWVLETRLYVTTHNLSNMISVEFYTIHEYTPQNQEERSIPKGLF